MGSSVDVFKQQAAGYDNYIRENWQELEQWERDYHAAFRNWASNRRNVRRFVAVPSPRYVSKAKNWNESLMGVDTSMRTVGLAYALIVASIFFFPLPFAAAAAGFGFINSVRGRWDHGLIQIVLAGAVVACYVNGVSLSAESYAIYERTANLIPLLRDRV